jgi:hypothetical protein
MTEIVKLDGSIKPWIINPRACSSVLYDKKEVPIASGLSQYD